MDEHQKEPEINIYYEKNPLYRTIYADGVIGGVTPDDRTINLNFYASRNSIPKSVTHIVESDGTINSNGVKGKDSKSGIVREVEFGVYLNRNSAENIYEFLKKVLNK